MAKNQKTTPAAKEKWYKPFIVPGVIALVLAGGVLIFVRGEIDRFTLIMPIFAGYILYMILTSVDDEDEKK
ncbi:MAG: hypothetical protein M1426_00820 [Patescibacteria group bacterium]|nr:hypothetical protein [Patescibacteria group bacterium]